MSKILAMAASIRPDSLNKKLLALASAVAQEAGAEVTLFDYTSLDVPLYHDDGRTVPPAITTLANALRAHDGIILASPEYNWSIPGGLKNVIDWLSVEKPNALNSRHALLMCASPSMRGGILGLNQLQLPLAHLGMRVYPHLIAIGDAKTQLDGTGIRNPRDAIFLRECVTDFIRTTNALKDEPL